MIHLSFFRRRSLARKARELEVRRDWAGAAQTYSKLAALPGGTRASEQMRLAHALEESGALEQATRAYRQGVAQHPTAPNVHRQQALHLLRLNRRHQAGEAFLRGFALAPGDETLLRDIQREGFEEGDVTSATLLAFLSTEQPLERQRGLGRAAKRLRRVARDAARAERWTAAVEAYQRLIALAPPAAQDLLRLGHALKASGDFLEAERQYWRALSVQPRSPEVYLQLGHVLKLRALIEEAQLAYLIAWRLQPGHQDVEVELVGQGWTRARLQQVASQAWVAVPRESGAQQPDDLLPRAAATFTFDASPPPHLSRIERALWGDLAQVMQNSR